MRYGMYHRKKYEKYDELINNGELKSSFDIIDHNGDDIRVRIIRYKCEVWVIHIKNEEILEIFTV